jgi:hypothetical protein
MKIGIALREASNDSFVKSLNKSKTIIDKTDIIESDQFKQAMVLATKMVTEGIEPSTVALLAQRSNQLSYATFLLVASLNPNNTCHSCSIPIIEYISIFFMMKINIRRLSFSW